MHFTINTVGFVFIILGCLVAGVIGGFLIARKVVSKQLKDNPPINRDRIKARYRSMGRTPSEAQINSTRRAINDAQKKSQKK